MLLQNDSERETNKVTNLLVFQPRPSEPHSLVLIRIFLKHNLVSLLIFVSWLSLLSVQRRCSERVQRDEIRLW